jgi:hypothetical protein
MTHILKGQKTISYTYLGKMLLVAVHLKAIVLNNKIYGCYGQGHI